MTHEQMKEFRELGIVLGSWFTGNEILQTFRTYAPDFMQALQIIIALLTIAYLLVKIFTHNKKHERSN